VFYLVGWVAEWFKAPVLKTGVGCKVHRGFESLPIRLHSAAALRGLSRFSATFSFGGLNWPSSLSCFPLNFFSRERGKVSAVHIKPAERQAGGAARPPK
jgi:hypothetical protein